MVDHGFVDVTYLYLVLQTSGAQCDRGINKLQVVSVTGV